MTGSSLPPEKKLNVLYRIEPGCLGPDGPDHAEAFCQFVNQNLTNPGDRFIIQNVVARFDKSLPEMEYRVVNKLINHHQAAKYLSGFDMNLDQFEEQLHEQIGELIEQFLKR